MKQGLSRSPMTRMVRGASVLRGVWGFSAAAVLCALAVTPVFAQEAGGEVSSTNTVFRWINFAIVFALIALGFAKAGPAFRRNAAEISKRIAEGARAREAAEAERREVQAKLARIDEEVAQLRADAKRATEVESQRLRAMAKEEAQNIERAGQAEISAAERAARIELKALAGSMAVTQAETVLRDRMTPEAEAAIFRTFIEELQGSSN